MALKDIWTNKTDDVDYILADDINAIANEVISNTENKADKAEIPTKVSELENDTNYVTNTDYATALETKVDKTDLDWKLIGETEITEEGDFRGITLDLGTPVENWYRETMIQITVPKTYVSENDYTNSEAGSMRISFGVTAEASFDSYTSENTCSVVASQTKAYAPINHDYANYIIATSYWSDDGILINSRIDMVYRGYKGYPYYSYGVPYFNYKNNIIGKQYLTLSSNGQIFIFPVGAKISLYGRM